MIAIVLALILLLATIASIVTVFVLADKGEHQIWQERLLDWTHILMAIALLILILVR